MKGYLEFNVCDNLLIFAKPNNKKNNQTSYYVMKQKEVHNDYISDSQD